MKQATATNLTLACLCLLICLVGLVGWQMLEVRDGVELKFATLDKGIQTIIDLEGRSAVTLTQTVNNQAGEPVTVTTTRKEGEDEETFYNRHKAMVDYVKAH